eukprot:3217873-Amphidinium_carterae.2
MEEHFAAMRAELTEMAAQWQERERDVGHVDGRFALVSTCPTVCSRCVLCFPTEVSLVSDPDSRTESVCGGSGRVP